MKSEYKEIIKERFRKELIRTRYEAKLTQEEMAEKLDMSARSYSDLEAGKSCCSAVTFVLYLFYVCDDRNKFLDEIYTDFEKICRV